MNLWKLFLRMTGWKTDISAPYRNKCVICVAPHTSNWDFIIGLAAYKSLGRNANFLMKEFWFFFPLNFILKGLGGIPVPRKKKGAKLTEVVINKFRTSEYCNLAVTPEGTRSKQTEWKTGFLYIATEADVPIQLGVIDFKNKEVIIRDEYFPTGNIESDMKAIKAFYADKSSAARYPEKFSI